MNLTSCNNCAVVLDKDKLDFSFSIYLEDGSIDANKAIWDGDNFVPFVDCPVCHNPITQLEAGAIK